MNLDPVHGWDYGQVWYGVQRSILDTLRFGMGDATIGLFTWNQVGGLLFSVIGVFFSIFTKKLKI